MRICLKILLISGLFFFFVYSCYKVTYKSCVRDLVGYKIDIPDSLYELSPDTLNLYDLSNHGTMILTWVDSLMCKPCFFQSLFRWEPLIEMSKSDTLSFDCVFIISPRRKDDIKLLSEMIELLPKGSKVLIDKDNLMSKKNEMMNKYGIYINTYLVSSSDSIELIGNPIQNDAIWDLYIQQIHKMK